jgi:hypothetical protein
MASVIIPKSITTFNLAKLPQIPDKTKETISFGCATNLWVTILPCCPLFPKILPAIAKNTTA